MKKRFLFLLLGLNLLIVSSISMSLAWFLGSVNLGIDDILINVDVDADLKISTSNNFEYAKDSLTGSDLGKIPNLVPVSSMCSEHSEWINDKNYSYPVFAEQYKRGNVPVPEVKTAKSGYYSQIFYLFTDKHMLVTFDSKKTVVAANKDKNWITAETKAEEKALKNYRAVADAEMIRDNIEESKRNEVYDRVYKQLKTQYKNQCFEELNKIEDSLRISILDFDTVNETNYTIIDPKKCYKDAESGATITKDPVVFGGRLSTSITRDYFDYYIDQSTGEYKETLFGDIKYQEHELVYNDPCEEDLPPEEGIPSSCFNAGTRKGVRCLDQDDLKTNVEFYTEQSITPEQADVSTHPDDEESGYLIDLKPNVPHKLTVSVYLEGWDPDSLDFTQEGAFDMSIHFRLYRQGDFQ